MIQACLNGRRTAADHGAVPLTPAQLAAAARTAMAAGADSVHLHPRDDEGQETLVIAWVEPAVRAVRQACPGLPVGVSTGLWMCGEDAAARQVAVQDWAAAEDRPDFASVNLSEPGFKGLTQTLRELGVGVEAGVWSEHDAAGLLAGSSADSCTRILVELIDMPAPQALLSADRIVAMLRKAEVSAPILLHGEGASTWPVLDKALSMGLETRIGLEDTLTDPAGDVVADNDTLIRIALSRKP